MRRRRVPSSIALALFLAAAGAAACSSSTENDPRVSATGGSASASSGGMPSAGSGHPSSSGMPSAGGGSAATTGGAANPPRVCAIQAPTACPEPAPTYVDVEPIFGARCVVCHDGVANGPWPLNSYGHVASWRDSIRAVLLGCVMPPVDSGMSIPDQESLLILTWIRCGMPI